MNNENLTPQIYKRYLSSAIRAAEGAFCRPCFHAMVAPKADVVAMAADKAMSPVTSFRVINCLSLFPDALEGTWLGTFLAREVVAEVFFIGSYGFVVVLTLFD